MTDILIIDDSFEICNLLRDFLCRDGWSCEVRHSGEEGLAFLRTETVRIVLLDVMLPGMDGFQVCRELRLTQEVPLVILSARTGKEDKLTGLDLGADDYIEKPCDLDLLRAKLKTLYRRHYEPESSRTLEFGDLVIDTAGRTAARGCAELKLSAKEFDLLLLLCENKGKALRKEFLFDKVWGADSFSEPSSLTVHINWLRSKIEKDPAAPRRIVTVWGTGYKFEGQDAGSETLQPNNPDCGGVGADFRRGRQYSAVLGSRERDKILSGRNQPSVRYRHIQRGP